MKDRAGGVCGVVGPRHARWAQRSLRLNRSRRPTLIEGRAPQARRISTRSGSVRNRRGHLSHSLGRAVDVDSVDGDRSFFAISTVDPSRSFISCNHTRVFSAPGKNDRRTVSTTPPAFLTGRHFERSSDLLQIFPLRWARRTSCSGWTRAQPPGKETSRAATS